MVISMRAVIQRVKKASVSVAGKEIGAVRKGALVFLAVAKEDTRGDLDFLLRKVSQLRMFEDDQGKMNLSAADVSAEFLVVSQFTLLGDCAKGRRPSFDNAAGPEKGEEYYRLFVSGLKALGFTVSTGQFRAMMEVALVNDGPVTFVIDS